MCIVSASSTPPNSLILEKPPRPGEKLSFSRSLGVIVDFLLGSVSELVSIALVPLEESCALICMQPPSISQASKLFERIVGEISQASKMWVQELGMNR